MVNTLSLKRSMLVLPAALAVVCLLAAAAPSSSDAVTCKLKGSDKVKCPSKKLRGPTGPAGPQGPQGPAGGSDPSAPKVQRFTYLATGGQPTTTFQTFNGAVAESGCSAGAFVSPRLRGTSDNGYAEILNVRTSVFNFDQDLDSGQSVALPAGANDQMDMTYSSAGAGQIVTAHFAALAGAGSLGQFDCAIVGFSTVG